MLKHCWFPLSLLAVLPFAACDTFEKTPASGEVAAKAPKDSVTGEPLRVSKVCGSASLVSFGEDQSANAASVPDAKQLSATYANSCAGCHGSQGEGRARPSGEPFPKLPGQLTYAQFSAAVRQGKKEMPAWSIEQISDADLEHDYAVLTGKATNAGAANGLRRLSEISDDEYRANLADGLAVWRRAGQHGACASCHTPDGIDLARIGFSDATIIRRAIGQSVNAADAQKVVTMVHAVRRKYGIDVPCDAATFRPFQPGGAVLPGDTVVARDMAFFAQLKKMGLLVATQTIKTESDARKAEAQLTAVDLRAMKVGIPFNRWTEDGFHGDEHLTTAEWIPDVPCEPAPDKAAQWYDLHDAYISDPTDLNMWAIYDRFDELTGPMGLMPDDQTYDGLIRSKCKSILIGSHMLRRDSFDFPDVWAGVAEAARKDSSNRSPARLRGEAFWKVGDAARSLFNCKPPEAGVTCLTFPGYMKDKYAIDPYMTAVSGYYRQNHYRDVTDPTRVQLSRTIVPWFWLGWTFDPSLHKSGGTNSTLTGEYISQHTAGERDYWFHQSFMTFMLMLHQFRVNKLHPDLFANGFVAFHDGTTYQGQVDPEPGDPRLADYPRFRDNLKNVATLVFGPGNRDIKN